MQFRVLSQRFSGLERIARSSFSTVYRGRDTIGGHLVAVKVATAVRGAPRDALIREFEYLSGFVHPYVVRVHDFGIANTKLPFFAMEWVPGRTLVAAVQGSGPTALVDTIPPLCQALAGIHESGYVYGDISPSNVLLTSTRDGVKTTLIDFGMIAKIGTLRFKELWGTPDFIPPEVFRGDPLTPASDVYTFGVLLKQMLTDPARFPHSRIPVDVDVGALQDLVQGCLAYHPELRPRGFREIEDTWWTKVVRRRAGLSPTPSIRTTSLKTYGLKPYLNRLQEYCRELSDAGGGIVFVCGCDGIGKSTLIAQHRRLVQMQGQATLRLLCGEHHRNAAAVRSAIEMWTQETKGVHTPDSAAASSLFVYLESEHAGITRTEDVDLLISTVKGKRISCIVESPLPPPSAPSPDIRTIDLNSPSRELFEKICEAVFADVPFISSLASFLHAATGGIPGLLHAKKLEYATFNRRHGSLDRFNWRKAPPRLLAHLSKSIAALPREGRQVARWCTRLRTPFSATQLAQAVGIAQSTAERWLGRLADIGILKTDSRNGQSTYDTFSLWVEGGLREIFRRDEGRVGEPVKANTDLSPSRRDQKNPSWLLSVPAVAETGDRRMNAYRDFRHLAEAVFVCRRIYRQKAPWADIPDSVKRAIFSAVVSNYEAAGDLAKARAWTRRLAQVELLFARREGRPNADALAETIGLLDKYGTPDQRFAWLRAVADRCPDVDPHTKALLTSERGAASLAMKNLDAARKQLYEAEAQFALIGGGGVPRALNLSRIGVVYQLRGDYEKARRFFARADAMLAECPERALETQVMVKINAGTVLMACGLARDARAYFLAARSIADRTHNLKMQSYVGRNLVLCAAELESAPAAVRAAHDALASSRKARVSTAEPSCHSNLGWTYLRAGDVRRARAHLGLAIGLSQKQGDLRVLCAAFLNVASLHRLQGDLRSAVSLARRSFRMAQRIGSSQAQAEALQEISFALYGAGKPKTAKRVLDQAVHLCPRGGDLRSQFTTNLIAAEVDIARDDPIAAENRLTTWETMGSGKLLPGWVCDLGRVHGLLHAHRGNMPAAIQVLKDSAASARKLERCDLLVPIYETLLAVYMKSTRTHAALPVARELRRLYQKVEHMTGKRKIDELVRELEQASDNAHTAEMILQLSQSLTRFSEKRQLLDHLLGLAVDHFGADRGAIVSRHPISKRLFVETHRGLDSAIDQHDALGISRTVVRKVSQAGAAVRVDDARSDPLTRTKKSIIQQNIQAVLCVPVIAGGNVWGALYLDNRSVPEAFKHTDVKVLQALANFMALAIGQSDEFARLRLQSGRAVTGRDTGLPFIAVSPKMQTLLRTVDRIADSAATAVILGENGTGKDLLARYIHDQSRRKDRPFITMNCAGLVESLAETELFGIEDNVATGVRFREGKFKLADGGTLFLNEIGDLPLVVQAKVLQALQDRIIERVGGTPMGVDVRFIAATNKELKHMIAARLFREDLYYRISSITLTLPPLRERVEDIPGLARHFLEHYCQLYSRTGLKFDQAHLDEFMEYNWPGNIRELKGVIERGVLLAEGGQFPVGLTTSGSERPGPRRKPDHRLRKTLEDTERQCILEVLETMGWNQSRAANRLGISESSLRSKMMKLSIKKPRRA